MYFLTYINRIRISIGLAKNTLYLLYSQFTGMKSTYRTYQASTQIDHTSAQVTLSNIAKRTREHASQGRVITLQNRDTTAAHIRFYSYAHIQRTNNHTSHTSRQFQRPMDHLLNAKQSRNRSNSKSFHVAKHMYTYLLFPSLPTHNPAYFSSTSL
ncbi:hypothetical protein RND81_12G052000 [Saponaria officinalis]|uniref:Uncharacterized protein n=1 Tax=Saponaria officinalis TaxID=3572 RepID=A0AAW1H3E6_SAPOF